MHTIMFQQSALHLVSAAPHLSFNEQAHEAHAIESACCGVQVGTDGIMLGGVLGGGIVGCVGKPIGIVG